MPGTHGLAQRDLLDDGCGGAALCEAPALEHGDGVGFHLHRHSDEPRRVALCLVQRLVVQRAEFDRGVPLRVRCCVVARGGRSEPAGCGAVRVPGHEEIAYPLGFACVDLGYLAPCAAVAASCPSGQLRGACVRCAPCLRVVVGHFSAVCLWARACHSGKPRSHIHSRRNRSNSGFLRGTALGDGSTAGELVRMPGEEPTSVPGLIQGEWETRRVPSRPGRTALLLRCVPGCGRSLRGEGGVVAKRLVGWRGPPWRCAGRRGTERPGGSSTRPVLVVAQDHPGAGARASRFLAHIG